MRINRVWAMPAAEYHMDAYDFLVMLLNKGVKSDLIIFDPPYSIQQSKQIYESFGAQKFTVENAQNVGHWSKEKKVCYQLLSVGGYFLHFGWHSNGMGKGRDTQIDELLLVAHGRSHNDTICMAEKKLAHQSVLFAETHLTPPALDGTTLPDNQQSFPADVLDGDGVLPEPHRQ